LLHFSHCHNDPTLWMQVISTLCCCYQALCCCYQAHLDLTPPPNM
jgi:hypothetical protein